MNDSTRGSEVTLDLQNPWLGLVSYSEETRAYFHGRDEETAELARRVQRKNLTVLFGQSGLGKTSLLRAGLVPRLRLEGYCPVYVRVDYAPDSPSPSEQIKQAVFRATAEAGVWTRPGASVEGESLWEFLHHRGDLLRDVDGNPLMPLLIFDQFEEIFTLGQADDVGRKRAAEFLADLADLVENRPPEALERRLEEDDAVAEDFDFARADYRVLIALREDYLAHLESIKGLMPSITQNRMRLARMTGAQALSAVTGPGGKLVSQEVAESIVRFVAGGSELANAEIEPSLLSLVCRELNTARISQGRSEISADLLAGSRETILSEFYERALADQPDGVRRVIEDELLTESGYRESLAEERVSKALAEAGAGPDALATLVNRRLLRIEDRLDMRRVELTHDVLCNVVLASRNLRHEREARDAAQRQLAEQKAREQATHRAMLRARMVATVCAVLMLLAIAGAIFGWVNYRRASVAETEAQDSRHNAEKLVGFLIEDFYSELAPTGRLETLGKLARRTVGYYDGLPPDLVTPQTRINRAMAQVREGQAMLSSGKTNAALRLLAETQHTFENMQAAGNHSEPVLYGLGLSLEIPGAAAVTGIGNRAGSVEKLQKAATLLKPLVYSKDGSTRVKLLYADTLNFLSHTQPSGQGVKTCDEARKVLESIGALDLSNLDAAASYADTADSEARHLQAMGRIDRARPLEKQSYDLALKLLQQRPGDLHDLSVLAQAGQLMSIFAQDQYDDATALAYANKAAQFGEDGVRFNPSDMETWRDWAIALSQLAQIQADQGRMTQAIATMHKLVGMEQDKRRPSNLAPVLWGDWIDLAFLQIEMGDSAGADRSLQHFKRDIESVLRNMPKDTLNFRTMSMIPKQVFAMVKVFRSNPQSTQATLLPMLAQVDALEVPKGSDTARNKGLTQYHLLQELSQADIAAGDYPQAEKHTRRLKLVTAENTNRLNLRDPELLQMGMTTTLAHALAGQGKFEQARNTVQPAISYFREQAKAGANGLQFRHGFAYALYVDALASPHDARGRRQRKADLAEAIKLIAAAPGESAKTFDMRQLSGWIAKARHER